MKRALTIASLVVATIAVGGCQQMNDTQEYTLGGAALGAGAGALIGAGTGHIGTGIAIGTAAGAVGGALLSSDKND